MSRNGPHTMRRSPGRGHAVVVGASMAGLCVARALADTFDRVTVVDRDRLPHEAAHRNGAPQDRHLHAILAAGLDAFEELFPGLRDELTTNGAVTAGLHRWRFCLNGHRLTPMREHRAPTLIQATCPFIEAHVRERVRADPAITLLDRCEVRGVVPCPDRRRVLGARVMGRDDRQERTLHAELVVDCSGRRSPLPAWLAELGYPAPDVDEVHVDLRYVTRQYRLPPEALDGDVGVLSGFTPELGRGAGLERIENDRWIVTLAGIGGERPPLQTEPFHAYAATLPIPDVHDAIVGEEPLDEPAAYRYPSNRRHRYERLDDFPSGLLVAGDAVSSFDPVYGQGMTVAALEAVALRNLLRRGQQPSARRWFAAIEPVVDVAWDIATGTDIAIAGVEGHAGLRTRLINAYVSRLHAAAAHDPTLAELFIRVFNFLDPPGRLLWPGAAARVLRGNLPRRGHGASPPRGVTATLERDAGRGGAGAGSSSNTPPSESDRSHAGHGREWVDEEGRRGIVTMGRGRARGRRP